jgi:hypothetical protein
MVLRVPQPRDSLYGRFTQVVSSFCRFLIPAESCRICNVFRLNSCPIIHVASPKNNLHDVSALLALVIIQNISLGSSWDML